MAALRTVVKILMALGLVAGLAGCGGCCGSTAATAYTVGGSVSGLAGTGLVLQNNAADDKAIGADGAFTFAVSLANSVNYAVTVKSQPSNPAQTCTVNSGSGTMASTNISNVAVICSINTYTVSGTVSGLSGSGLVLQNNMADDKAISANGAFTFTTPVAGGANYSVTVKTLPTVPAQTCTVTGGVGAVSAANITSVAVNCVTPSPRFAYVANAGDNTVSSYTVNATTGQLRHNGYVATEISPHGITVDPSGKFAYVTNWGSNTVSAYSINASTGTLTSVGAVATGIWPYSVTVDPSGKFAYVSNEASFTVSAYTINASTGALTEVDQNGAAAGTAVAAGQDPRSVTVDPSGKFAYVANATANSISAYTINASTGALTEIDQNGAAAGTAVATELTPQSVTVDPSGKFAYAANLISNTVSAYTIDTSTGVLTNIGVAVPTGTYPISVTVDPTGKFAYVANNGSNDVSAYTINATTGALSIIGTVPTGAGTNPRSVMVDPSAKFAYVANANSNNVQVFTINASTGALTSAGSVSGRSSLISIAMTKGATPVTYTPKFAYVANGSANTISTYTINASTGVLTDTGVSANTNPFPYSITFDPSGRFAYVAGNSSSVVLYTVDATSGALTLVSGYGPVYAPLSITVDPSGKFAYVANSFNGAGGNSVSAFAIDATNGTLTEIDQNGAAAGTTVAAGSAPASVTVDPSGKFAYVANQVSYNVSAYTINSITGVLTAVAGSPFATAGSANSVTVDPTGKFVYVANQIGGISAFTINATSGVLTPVSGSPFATGGLYAAAITIAPSGKFAYVAHDGSSNISAFNIDPASGALSAVVGSPFAAGIGSLRTVSVDPSGKFVYVASYNSAVPPLAAAFSIDVSTGALTSIGTVATGSWSVSVTTTGSIQ